MLIESAGASPVFGVEGRNRFRLGYPALVLLLSIELVGMQVARLPESMRFDRFAFCDHGANLTLQYLIANGLRPSLDFGYTYGLIPPLVGRFWFGLFGATPWTYQAAMVVTDILCAWAIARTLSYLKIGAVGLALALITVGYSCHATYVNFAHAIEAILLCFAIAQQTRGSLAGALAFATAAVFAKPSMGYVYGLLLVLLIVRNLRLNGFSLRRLLTAFTPAAVVFLSLAAVICLTYGLPTFLLTVLPVEGVTHYRALNFGLLRAGRGLWDPKTVPWIFYLVGVSGFWIASTIFLFGSALFQFYREGVGTLAARRSEILVTCAILHLAFLVLFFGNQWSWIYYSYILMIGTVIAVDLGPGMRGAGVALCVLALLSWISVARWSQQWWKNTAPDPATAGLWAPEDERTEWLQVLAMARGHKAVILDTMGAAELLSPGFAEPVSLFLLPGLMLPADLRRKLEQLSNAEIVVVPTITIVTCSGIPDASEFKDALKSFDLAWSGKHFEVFRRGAVP